MNKGMIAVLTVFIAALGLISFSHNNKNNTEDVSQDTITSDSDNVNEILEQNLTIDEMKDIARDLFDDYINENRTDWYFVKAENLDRDPVICLKDYKINSIDFVKQDNNKFTVDISYDIQCSDESNYWAAGNGELSYDNWVVNKCTFVDIVKVDNKYFITNVYTE